MADPRRKRTVACPCGAAIPYRNMYDFYRITPHHNKIRAEQAFRAIANPVSRFRRTT